jgi:hypothetical protein
MQIAPEITFEGSESSDAARAQILGEIEKLETHNSRITGCRVKLIAPSYKHRHGTGFQVHIWLTLPPHENIVVDNTQRLTMRGTNMPAWRSSALLRLRGVRSTLLRRDTRQPD